MKIKLFLKINLTKYETIINFSDLHFNNYWINA